MTLSLDFLAVMVVLYLMECLRRVGPDELTLDRRLGSGFRLKWPAAYPNKARWGWVFLNPLRPDGPSFSLTPAVCLIENFEEIRSADLCIRNLDAARFDLDRIRDTCVTLRQQTVGIRRATIILLVACFALFPACLALIGLRATLAPAAVVALLVSMFIAGLYVRWAKVIAQGTTSLDVYGNAVRLMLYPFSAIRCADLLTRNSLAAFDPIAVATALCSPEKAARLALTEIAILRYGVLPQESDIAEYRAARLELLDSFVKKQGLPVQELIGPRQAETCCQTYCPACAAQFRLVEGVCPDCRDIVLQPLQSSNPLPLFRAQEESNA